MEESMNPAGAPGLSSAAEPETASEQGNLMRLLNSADGEDASLFSPLVLAYLGDAVYELMIRTMVVKKGNRQVNKMNRETTGYVRASAQASMMRILEPLLTEKEHAVYKRGRNAKSYTMAKHATMIDYRTATAFEALAGYLWLSGDTGRLMQLIGIGMAKSRESDG